MAWRAQLTPVCFTIVAGRANQSRSPGCLLASREQVGDWESLAQRKLAARLAISGLASGEGTPRRRLILISTACSPIGWFQVRMLDSR